MKITKNMSNSFRKVGIKNAYFIEIMKKEIVTEFTFVRANPV